MARKIEFLCLNCGRTDYGAYCSNCRYPLRVPEDQLSTLLAKRLLRCYHIDLKSNGELSFPYKELKTKLTMLSEQSEQLLAFDGVFRVRRYIQVIAVIATSQKSKSDIAKLVKEACISLRTERKKLFPGIKFIWITFYLLFEDNHSVEYLKQIKKSLSLKYRRGFVAYTGSLGIDVRHKKIHGSRLHRPELPEVKSALLQIGENAVVETAGEKAPPSVRKAVKEALRTQVIQRFIDFWNTWVGLALNSSLVAKRLADDKIDISEIIKFYFLSVMIAGILGRIMGNESNLPPIYPVVDEFLNCLFWLLVALFWVPMEHLILIAAKGKGRFRHAYFAKLYTIGITLPIITLIEGVALKLKASPETMHDLFVTVLPTLNFMLLVPFLSISYKMNPKRLQVLFIFIVPMLIIVLLLFVYFVSMLFAS